MRTSTFAQKVSSPMNFRTIGYVVWIGLLLISPIDDALAIVLCSGSFLAVWAAGAKKLYQQHASAARDLVVRSGIFIAILNATSFANLIYDLQFNKFIVIAITSVACWLVFARYRIVGDDLVR